LNYRNGEAFYRNFRRGGYLRYLVLLGLVEYVGMSKEDLEKNVVSYRFGNGLRIYNPKLPIRITPVFDSVIIHLMLDGSVSGRRSEYKQRSSISSIDFHKRLNIY